MLHDTSSTPEGDGFFWPATEKRNEINITALAAAALLSVDGDRDQAVPIFLRSLRAESVAEYEYRASVAMRNWSMDMLRSAESHKRREIADNAQMADVEERRARMTKPNQALSAESLKSVAEVWMDWPVLPGVLLRNATRAELNQAAQDYLKRSGTMTRRANWLSAIAEGLPDDEIKVSDAMKESDVAKLAAKHKV